MSGKDLSLCHRREYLPESVNRHSGALLERNVVLYEQRLRRYVSGEVFYLCLSLYASTLR